MSATEYRGLSPRYLVAMVLYVALASGIVSFIIRGEDGASWFMRFIVAPAASAFLLHGALTRNVYGSFMLSRGIEEAKSTTRSSFEVSRLWSKRVMRVDDILCIERFRNDYITSIEPVYTWRVVFKDGTRTLFLDSRTPGFDRLVEAIVGARVPFSTPTPEHVGWKHYVHQHLFHFGKPVPGDAPGVKVGDPEI